MIEFEQNTYEVVEDIGLDNFALRVCFNVINLQSPRNITLSTQTETADGKFDQMLVSRS